MTPKETYRLCVEDFLSFQECLSSEMPIGENYYINHLARYAGSLRRVLEYVFKEQCTASKKKLNEFCDGFSKENYFIDGHTIDGNSLSILYQINDAIKHRSLSRKSVCISGVDNIYECHMVVGHNSCVIEQPYTSYHQSLCAKLKNSDDWVILESVINKSMAILQRLACRFGLTKECVNLSDYTREFDFSKEEADETYTRLHFPSVSKENKQFEPHPLLLVMHDKKSLFGLRRANSEAERSILSAKYEFPHLVSKEQTIWRLNPVQREMLSRKRQPK